MAKAALRHKALRDNRVRYTSADVIRENAKGEAVYRVKMEEVEGAKKASWWEKATGRDFSIGFSVGGALTFLAGVFGGPLAGVPAFALFGGGALIGAISDYTRNSAEFHSDKGVTVPPPTHFNRDMVKSALMKGLGAKLALVVGGVALAAMGAPFMPPGVIEGVSAAFSGGGGILGAIAAPIKAIGVVASAIPTWLNVATYATGMLIGAKQGADRGYALMEKEYKAAERKHKSPSSNVSVAKEKSVGPLELGAMAAAPAIATAIQSGARTNEADASLDGSTVNASTVATVGKAPTQQIAQISDATSTQWRNKIEAQNNNAKNNVTSFSRAKTNQAARVGQHTDAVLAARENQAMATDRGV